MLDMSDCKRTVEHEIRQRSHAHAGLIQEQQLGSWAELASPVRMCSLATRPLPAEMDCDGAETQSLNIILDRRHDPTFGTSPGVESAAQPAIPIANEMTSRRMLPPGSQQFDFAKSPSRERLS
jgi:hypothetical protein